MILLPLPSWQLLLTLLTLINIAIAEVDTPIEIKGSKFFYSSNGTQFYARGIWYGPSASGGSTEGSFVDALADTESCTRDVPYLRELNINVISVWAISSTNTHKACLQLLAANDIYVLIRLTTVTSINNDTVALPQWTTDNFNGVTPIIDEFSAYPNTLGFYAGYGTIISITISDSPNTAFLPFPKAAARDIKNYMQQNQYRAVPVGYAANEIDSALYGFATYMACYTGEPDVDFFAFAEYSWCGDSSYLDSGYSELTTTFYSYPIPVLFSEYGCNVVEPRTFGEVNAIYGSQMTPRFSGGFLYEYLNESSGFGVVEVSGSNVQTLPDFDYFSSRMASISPNTTQMNAYSPTVTAAACLPVNPTFSASPTLPPRPFALACDCMMDSVTCLADESVMESDLYSSLCSRSADACDGISSDPTAGVYGAWSMCSLRQKTSFTLSNLYGNASACTQSNLGTPQSPTPLNSTCSFYLQQAGQSGTGTITSYLANAVITAGPQNGGGSGGSNTNTNPSSGLSTGAQAGIGVGVALAALALIGGLALLAWRRRKQKNKLKLVKTEAVYPKAELPAEEGNPEVNGRGPHNLDGNPRSEVHGETAPQELEVPSATLNGPWNASEMPANEDVVR